MTFTPLDFVSKWKRAEARERQSVQEHFLDLCQFVGHPTPIEANPSGTRFAFEMEAACPPRRVLWHWPKACPSICWRPAATWSWTRPINANHALSYADAFAVAAAMREQAVMLTGDPEFESAEDLVEVEWLKKA